ncbi:Replication factor A protein 2 [Smittium mucronatum]|uniref:Replication factor A protein 2 n=1 Tax=Smittium mucronatum TaxID=133383 RepID=A0A1R0GUJ1_9FUNG|nr:Replication factor A protein 2 [Smittium mucronatum]
MNNYGGNSYSSQSNQYGGGFSSQGGGEDGKKKESFSQQTLTPATIRMLLNVDISQPDNPMEIDGVELKTVSIIGVVRNINSQTTMTQYTLEDGSGSIDVKMWTNQGAELEDSQNMVVSGAYAKVVGDFRLFNNKRHILAHSIKPLVNFNEMSYHGLEAIMVHLERTKGNSSTKGGVMASNYSGGGIVESNFGDGVVKRVYDYISSINNKMEGVSITEIENSLGPNITPSMIKEATYKLVDQGNIYTVMDDSHFISTHSGM